MRLEEIRKMFKEYKASPLTNENGIRASVLVPLFEKEGEIHILLIKRTNNVRVHKGEISFPGGVYEKKDIDPLRTALRESYEEIGIKEEDVETIGMMDEEKTTTGFIIRPYIGIIPYPYNFILNPREVAYIIHLPVTYLKDVSFDESSSFIFEGETIWGATGRILKKFLNIAGYKE